MTTARSNSGEPRTAAERPSGHTKRRAAARRWRRDRGAQGRAM